MIVDLLRSFRVLFTSKRSRWEVAAVISTMAAIPVAEMLVLRTFSHLIVSGPSQFAEDPSAVLRSGAVFFLGFAATRAVHHLVRFVRVRVFHRRFDESSRKRTPSQEAWEWALAFELSGVLVGLVQIVAFAGLFFYLDVVTGAANVVVSIAVLVFISWIYRRQLRLQREWVKMGSKPGTTSIGARVGSRIRSAEAGAILATGGLAVMLVVMLSRVVSGDLSSADAIIFFIGLRILYGHVSALSGGVMRFARASARRGVLVIAEDEDDDDGV
ncbi:MAG: hypothetical protein WCF36_12480 [Candidatus Nanopelagicales bacterium]